MARKRTAGTGGERKPRSRRYSSRPDAALPGLVKTRVTFKDAANEWLRHGEVERGIKPSTYRDYKSAVNRHLIPAFGDMKIEDVTAKTIERWRARQVADGKLPRRTANKLVAILHGIFERARDEYELDLKNPAAGVKRFPDRYDPTSLPPGDARTPATNNPARSGAGGTPASMSTLRTVVAETATPRVFEFADDPPVAPAWVLLREANDQRHDGRFKRRPPRL